MNLHEQARAEAEKWLGNYHGSIDATAIVLAFLAGHEAAARTRVVTTVAELDALVEGAVILDKHGSPWRVGENRLWWGADWSGGWDAHDLLDDDHLPARVLYEPEETR